VSFSLVHKSILYETIYLLHFIVLSTTKVEIYFVCPENSEVFQILCGQSLIACSFLLIGVSLSCHWLYSRCITRDSYVM